MLKPIEEPQLEMILSWRNAPRVREAMFTDHVISMEEHVTWWSKLQKDATKDCRVFYHQEKPAGVITYYDIDRQKSECYWGFFMNHDIPVGTKEHFIAWLSLGKMAVEYGFAGLNCQRLLCETFAFNEAVLKLNYLLGFREVKVYQKEKAGKMEDVIVMALENKGKKQ